MRRHERQSKTARIAIVFLSFLIVLGAALLAGGKTFIAPMLRSAAEPSEAHRMGHMVIAMRDGAFCRHLSFDNRTAQLTEGAVEHCSRGRTKGTIVEEKGFSWGAR